MCMGRVDHRTHRGAVQHGARGVGGGRHHQTLQVQTGEIRRNRLQAVFGRGEQINRHQPQRPQNLPIRRVTRRADSHPIATVEQRRKGQQKSTRRARSDHHPLGVQIDIVPLAIKPCDPLPQRRQPKGHRIAQRRVLHGARQSLRCALGGTGSGLAYFHVDDVAACVFAAAGGLHHVHHNERIDLGPG